MRKFLNRLLAPIGYRIERTSRFQEQLVRLSKNSSRGLKFVQIGANDGVRFDGLFAFATSHRCSGIVVEPLSDMFRRLEINYADYPGITPVNAAIHASARSLSLFRLSPEAVGRYEGWATGIASFDRDHLLRHGIAPGDIISESVACLTLMELAQRHDMLDADLLQIDTEGYDAEIVRMIDFGRFRPALIKYEHKNISGNEQSALLLRLREQNYSTEQEGTDTIAWRA